MQTKVSVRNVRAFLPHTLSRLIIVIPQHLTTRARLLISSPPSVLSVGSSMGPGKKILGKCQLL